MSARIGSPALIVAALLATPSAAEDAAGALWSRIANRNDLALFEDFKNRFPGNALARLATLRIAELKRIDLDVDRDRTTSSLPVPVDSMTGRRQRAEVPPFDEILTHLPSAAAQRKANVRSGPSTDSAIVGSLSPGDLVAVLANDGEWLRISYRGDVAYVSAPLVVGGTLGPDSSLFSGITTAMADPVVIAPTPRADCLSSPDRGCVRALLDTALAEAEAGELYNVVSTYGFAAATFFDLGDNEAGWRYFDAGLAYSAAREKSEYASAASNRAQELTSFCETLAANDQPRLALAACMLALAHARSTAPPDDVDSNSLAHWRADAIDDVAGALFASPQLHAAAHTVLREAEALLPQMQGGTLYSGPEERADFFELVLGQLERTPTRKLAALETGLRLAYELPAMDKFGDPNYSRFSGVSSRALALAELGFIDEAWRVAETLPPDGLNTSGEAMAQAVNSAYAIDKELGAKLYERLIAAGASPYAQAIVIRQRMGSGDWADVEAMLSGFSNDAASASEIAQGYSENGRLDDALMYAAYVTDPSMQETVGKELVEDLAAYGRLDDYSRIAALYPAVEEDVLRSYVNYGVDRSHTLAVESFLRAGQPDVALDYLSGIGKSYDVLMVTRQKRVSEEPIMLARAVGVATPEARLTVLLQLLKALER